MIEGAEYSAEDDIWLGVVRGRLRGPVDRQRLGLLAAKLAVIERQRRES
jgi:hypothetical protein